ncbi:MAG: hypothetical protein M3256_20760 [Actinomycetota bacterium]|nr:hypothetical protein [Actinomycetota bacterium]
MPFDDCEEVLRERRLATPPGIVALSSAPPFEHAEPWLLRSAVSSTPEAFALLGQDAPENLLPFAVVDEASLACVVCAPTEMPDDAAAGLVVRWHLSDVAPSAQARLLDIGVVDYVSSLEEELAARELGLERMLDEIGPAYAQTYIAKDERPRDFVVRPVRIACQNVIVGLAAIAQESSFDGLSVVAWQTCEVPHVATHEANRAMAVLTLCDAFQNGGTMEIRFDKPAWLRVDGKQIKYDGHPEEVVPASLRRFGRTVGAPLGRDDPAAITPAEARALFEAITPMPRGLRNRFQLATKEWGISPERLCFTLLKPIWRDLELDFILATSARSASILQGGAPWWDRVARQAEAEVCRAAVIAGMLYRRLNATDAAGTDGQARVVEDRRRGVEWEIGEADGSVTFSGLDPSAPLPWLSGHAVASDGRLVVFPRTHLTPETIDRAAVAAERGVSAVALPTETELPSLPSSVLALRCPDRLPDVDRAIEEKLLAARISRE